MYHQTCQVEYVFLCQVTMCPPPTVSTCVRTIYVSSDSTVVSTNATYWLNTCQSCFEHRINTNPEIYQDNVTRLRIQSIGNLPMDYWIMISSESPWHKNTSDVCSVVNRLESGKFQYLCHHPLPRVPNSIHHHLAINGVTRGPSNRRTRRRKTWLLDTSSWEL